VRKSIVPFVLHEFVFSFNNVYKGLIYWFQGVVMVVVMEVFKKWCGLLVVEGAIDGTHISITKPQG
jgi:hypothetical protein